MAITSYPPLRMTLSQNESAALGEATTTVGRRRAVVSSLRPFFQSGPRKASSITTTEKERLATARIAFVPLSAKSTCQSRYSASWAKTARSGACDKATNRLRAPAPGISGEDLSWLSNIADPLKLGRGGLVERSSCLSIIRSSHEIGRALNCAFSQILDQESSR